MIKQAAVFAPGVAVFAPGVGMLARGVAVLARGEWPAWNWKAT
jgi:hypothetical protein